MTTSALYCANCGAAIELSSSEDDDVTCFACGKPLELVAAQSGSVAIVDQPLPGNLLQQRYLIVNQVGTGGFGAVYRAKDTLHHDKTVAIKSINLRDLKPQEVIEATDTFNREMTLLSDLAHSNLPRVYDHFTDAEHWYLVMDFIGGETLEEYVQYTYSEGRLPLDEVLDIGMQLCTVLDYLHSRQPSIIFRDVKPANIMHTPGGHLYLIDFGIARRFKPGQAKDTIALGSPGYAAPEQYGRAQTTPQTDLYGLGATLHHLLTGSDPSENPFHLAPLSAFDIAAPLELQELIAQMLEMDAAKRPQSAALVKQRLQHIAAEQLRTLYPVHALAQQQVYYVPPGTANSSLKQILLPHGPISYQKKKIVNASLLAFTVVMVLGAMVGVLSLNQHSYPIIGSASFPPGFAQPAPQQQQVYTMPIVGVPDASMLDPTQATDTQSMTVAAMLYSGLVTLNPDLTVQKELAASYSVSADHLTWTFHLRPGLKFSDGTPLTSHDVAYSIDRALQPATHASNCMNYLGMIQDANKLQAGQIHTLIGDSLLTPDNQTVIIKLSTPVSYFLTALAYSCSYVVEKGIIDHLDSPYVSGGETGPFEVQQYFPSSEIDLVPNPNYAGPQPQFLRVDLALFQSADASYKAFHAGKLDMTPIPPDYLQSEEFQQSQLLQNQVQPLLYYYGMNYLEKPFDNIQIRQAFALALSKNTIAEAIWHGGLDPTNHLLPQGMPGYNVNLTGPDQQESTSGASSQAQTLLRVGMQDEGWSSVSQIPPITFTYVDDNLVMTDEIQLAIQMWQSVLGIQVQARPVTGSTLQQEISATVNNPHGLQMWASNWQIQYPDPEDILSRAFGAHSPFNAVNYGQNNSSDVVAQQQVQQSLAANDTTESPERMVNYQVAEQQLVNDVAWIPMFQGTTPILSQPYVYGLSRFNFQPHSFIEPDAWANIFIANH
jgi:oligopeptide transport system substrate-binding protein